MIKKIVIALYCFGLFYGFCVASNDQYEQAKKSEQMVANYWKPDGNKHFSGSEEQ